VLPQATIFRVTKERWARVHGTNFSAALAAVYVGGALIAACSCWTARDLLLLPALYAIRLNHASDPIRSARVLNCHDRLIMAARSDDESQT
jgi:hypothetical protein